MQKEESRFISFADGLNRIVSARKDLGMEAPLKRIITSKDPQSERLTESLKVNKLPAGFQKWQLPFAFNGKGAQFFVSVAAPGATVEEHLHEEGDGVRLILSGSIEYAGQSLASGDWMYIPERASYSFRVGRLGATMFYCYQCCCVPV